MKIEEDTNYIDYCINKNYPFYMFYNGREAIKKSFSYQMYVFNKAAKKVVSSVVVQITKEK